MPLEQKKIEHNQSRQERQLSGMPLDGHLRSQPKVSRGLPAPANLRRRGAGFASDQVSGSDGAGKVGALGEMLTLVARCEDAAVTTGGGSTPGAELALVTGNLQGPAGVDASYGTPANPHISGWVHNAHEVFAYLDARKPKKRQSQVANQGSWTKAYECTSNWLSGQGHRDAQGHYSQGCGCDYAARARTVDLHVPMFAPSLAVG
jgi:hypothetical protein